MVTFQEYVQSRRDSSSATEQLQRSRSVGHGAAHTILQRLDDLQLPRSSTFSNRQHVAPGSINATITTPTRWPGVPAYHTADQKEVSAAAGGAGPQQFLSANSGRIQLLQEQVLSRSNSRRLAQQHTTTTIHSAVTSTAPSRMMSRAQSVKQLLVPREVTTTAAGPPATAPPINSSAHTGPNGPRLVGRAVMPLSVADALLSTSSSRSLDAGVPALAAATANYITPGSSEPTAQAAATKHRVAPALVQQQSQVLTGTPSSLSVTSTHSRSTAQHPSQQQPSQQQLAEGQAAAASSKAVALLSLQQQLRQMVKLQSLKNLQHQSSKLSRALSMRSRSPDAVGADSRTASASQSQPAGVPGGAQQLHQGSNVSRQATGDLDQQLQQQLSRCDSSLNADADSQQELPAVADKAAVLQQQRYDAARHEGSAQGFSPQASQTQHPFRAAAGEAAALLQPSVSLESSTHSQQAHPQQQQQQHQHQQQQQRHRLARQVTAGEPVGLSMAQEAASVASEATSSSGAASFISPETTVSSQQGYSATPAYKGAQHQHTTQPVESSGMAGALSEQPSYTTTDVSAVSEDVSGYNRQYKQPSHRHSNSYAKKTSRSRPSSTTSSSKTPLQRVESKAHSDILGDLDSDTQRDSHMAVMSVDYAHVGNHALLVARQHAQQLQQQNDALVRVLERERQQHEKTKQQVSDTQLELKEGRAEWEFSLQVLRQDNAALTAKLRKALAGGDQQEVLDAYDSALAASAAKVEEAQAAAAALAAQLTDTELQLQHVCSNNAMNGAACMSDDDGGEGTSRSDAAAVAIAVAAAGSRLGSIGRSPATAKTAAGLADPNCSRGLRALRQHQKHLEQQVTKQQQELSKLQRERIKLLRFRKQYDAVVGKLQSATSAQDAAAASAEEAGLRAAAAGGRADRLQQQVEQLQQDNQLQIAGQELEQQLQAVQEQLMQTQQELRVIKGLQQTSEVAQELAGVRSPLHQPAAVAADVVSVVPAAGAAGNSAQQLHKQASAASSSQSSQRSISLAGHNSPAVVAGTALPITVNVPAASRASNSPAVRRSLSLCTSRTPNGMNAAADGTKEPVRHLKHSQSAPDRPANSVCASKEALSLAQQVSQALPAEAHVQQQLTSLMSAIAAGIKEREALAAQGQVLLGMVVGAS